MWILSLRLHTASLHQAMRWFAVIGWFLTAVIDDWCISILAVPVGCSLSGPLFCSYPVVVFRDRGHPCFWNFIPLFLLMLLGRWSLTRYRLFHPACAPMRMTINKLYLIPKRIVYAVVGGGGGVLGTGKSIMLLYPVFQGLPVSLM